MDRYELAQVIAGKPENGWRWVQGTVVSVQAYSITVTLAGGSANVAGVKYLGHEPPVTGAGVWLISDGKDLLAVGSTASAGRSLAPHAYRTSTLSVANSTDTTVTWQDATGNGLGWWSAGTNPTRVTARAAGRYSASCFSRWAANGTGYRTAEIRLNGTTLIGRGAHISAAAGAPTQFSVVSPPLDLAIGDYLEVIVFQNSGAALDLAHQNAYSIGLALSYIGP